jgi:predicted RNA binding protein YcfA (HicA-like mRNA interferase family)
MTGHEFLRRLTKLAKAQGVQVVYDPRHGKGSHGRVLYGSDSTALKDPKKELGPGLLSKMCRNLGIKANDL